MRRGELLCLEGENVDPARQRICRDTKNGDPRTVPTLHACCDHPQRATKQLSAQEDLGGVTGMSSAGAGSFRQLHSP